MSESVNILNCPCGRKAGSKYASYLECCGRYIESAGQKGAPDAESLMRSRYSAYALQKINYLLNTWAVETRPTELDSESDLKWLGLTVKSCQQQFPDRATVEFVAQYRHKGKGGRLRELSHFVYRAGQWFYVDGVTN